MTNIYFIYNEATNHIKIGHSKDPAARRDQLQIGNSVPLLITYIIPEVPISFEAYIHSVCIRYSLEGEWFEFEAFNHLQRHPWFYEHMITYEKFKKKVPVRTLPK